MATAIEIARRPDAVVEFIDEVRATGKDEEARELRLQTIQSLIKFAQRFYVAFFAQELKRPLEITGFQYRDKRRVSRRLIMYEGSTRNAESDLYDTRLELGGYFEEFVDSLQGDLEFGYSTDIADFSEFHEEIYPGWLETVGTWCGAKDDEDSEVKLVQLAVNYRDAARI